jgi:hypothetical protein
VQTNTIAYDYKKSAYLINDALENTLTNNAFFEVTNNILRRIA